MEIVTIFTQYSPNIPEVLEYEKYQHYIDAQEEAIFIGNLILRLMKGS